VIYTFVTVKEKSNRYEFSFILRRIRCYKAHDNSKKKRDKKGRHKVISDKPEEENFADRIPMMTIIKR